MTTIIAKETPNGVQIGFDSLCTGYDAFELEQKKVFVNNGIVYGVAGRLLVATELKHADLPAPPKDPNVDLEKWVTRNLLPHIRRILNEVAPRRGDDGFSMQVLVVIRNKVFEISGDTCWTRRTDSTYTIGSGSPYAKGALDTGASIEHALLTAKHNDPGTGGTLTVTTADKLLKG